MNLLKEVNDWVQKGYDIGYLVTDQIENGYGKEVMEGDMPKYTYSFYIQEEARKEDIWDYSVDTLEEGFMMALDWLKSHRG